MNVICIVAEAELPVCYELHRQATLNPNLKRWSLRVRGTKTNGVLNAAKEQSVCIATFEKDTVYSVEGFVVFRLITRPPFGWRWLVDERGLFYAEPIPCT